MTVFKTFLKILNKNKFIVILYTVILVFFGAFNMESSDNQINFVASKPDLLIICKDELEGVTKNLVDYLEKHNNIVKIENTKEKVDDALFYRDVNYIVYINENYREEFLKGLNPKIEIKSTGDYQASLANMMLERYLKVANLYQSSFQTEEEIITKINETLDKEMTVEVTSKIDNGNLSQASFYYNFMNYSVLAGCVCIVCLILSSFRDEKIEKRTIVSSMNYKKYNRILLLSNGLFAISLWLIYVILSLILVKDAMFTWHGLIFIINAFLFTICALTIAFLISNLVKNKEAINGIVNVVALGSSFLCGSFVPIEWLPDTVLTFAHILPSYYFIKSNELLKEITVINLETLKPVFTNMLILIIFSIVFIVISNLVYKKQKLFRSK